LVAFGHQHRSLLCLQTCNDLLLSLACNAQGIRSCTAPHVFTQQEIHDRNTHFLLQVLNKLRDFVEEDSCRTQVVLLPSIRDVQHDPVFPQPPFRSALPPSIHTLTNPATFRVNEVVIGAATPDTLKQVGCPLPLATCPSLQRQGRKNMSALKCTNAPAPPEYMRSCKA